MDGWNTSFLLGPGLFSEAMLISGECTKTHIFPLDSPGSSGFIRIHGPTEVRTFVTYYGERLYIEPSVDEGLYICDVGSHLGIFSLPCEVGG